MYIIKRTDQWGGYLALAGSKNAYLVNPHRARKFKTREEAEAACCDNETVVPAYTDKQNMY